MNDLPSGDVTESEDDVDGRKGHHRILSIEVTGGFLDGTKLCVGR
jgi:hypothetical protein